MTAEPLLQVLTGGALRVLGLVLLLLGLAHVCLPRVLGWAPLTRAGLDGVVVRMHSGYVGMFVGVLGAICLLAAPELLAGGPLAGLVLAGGGLTFALRALAEVVWVGPALRGSEQARGMGALHRLGLVAWPAACLVLMSALVLSLLR